MSKTLSLVAPALLFVLVTGGLSLAFFYAPTEIEMGDIQRIFYFHAPAGITAFLAFAVTGVASALYLWKRRLIFDVLAHASAETGLLFCTIVLITGPFWARPVWFTWWTWEARLTTTLVLWLIYAAYILVRRYTEGRDQQARFAAVLGIIGALNIPIVYKSVTWWRGLHPIVVKESGGGGLDPEMRKVFFICIFIYLFLYACLMAIRVSLGTSEDELAELREEILERRTA
jgi:heme exporter protein C